MFFLNVFFAFTLYSIVTYFIYLYTSYLLLWRSHTKTRCHKMAAAMRHLRVGDSGAAQMVMLAGLTHVVASGWGLGWTLSVASALWVRLGDSSSCDTRGIVLPVFVVWPVFPTWASGHGRHLHAGSGFRGHWPHEKQRESVRSQSEEPMAVWSSLLLVGADTKLHPERRVDVTLLCIHPSILLPSLWENPLCYRL